MYRISFTCCLGLLLVINLSLSSNPLRAGAWAEINDAGDLPGTAQITLGVGSLDFITGEIFTSNDKDMYKISISDPATFSAIVIGGGSLLNSQLYLLDPLGSGVYGNDDITAVNQLSTLPAGDPNGPLAAGDYLLAISGYDNDPLSGAVETFTDNLLGVQTPTTAVVVNGWSPGVSTFGGTYTIALTGAEFATIPEPDTLVLFAAAMVGMILSHRRGRKSA